MITQKQVLSYLMDKRPFQASNIFACYDNNNSYVVYSYQTVILTIKEDGTVIYFDSSYHSHTTSKLQTKIKQAFNL